MSLVKIKNDILRAIAAARIEDLIVSAKLKDGRISLEVIRCAFDCFSDGVLQYDAHGNCTGMTMVLDMGPGRPRYLTEQAWELDQRLKAIAKGQIEAAGGRGGIGVHFGWPVANAQAKRKREAAATVAA